MKSLDTLKMMAAAGFLTLGMSIGGVVSASTVSYDKVWNSIDEGRYDDGSTTRNDGKNDCAGDLGTPPNCTLNDSPMIGKIDFNEDGSMSWEEGVFGNLFGLFSITLDKVYNEDKEKWEWANSGTFTYTPGANDPGITGFTAKGGSGYNVFLADGPVFQGMSASNVAFFAPDGKGMSHITFFDSVVPIPLPAAGWLLLTALGGMAVMRRRRKEA